MRLFILARKDYTCEQRQLLVGEQDVPAAVRRATS